MNDAVESLNPGQELQLFLRELIPLDRENDRSFVGRIDDALMADGDFLTITYESAVNYMVRRLITTAEYLRRKYDPVTFPGERYIIEIRRFLRDFTRIPPSKLERILTLLLICLRERDRELTQKTKNRVRRDARQRLLGCYICGGSFNYDQENEFNSFEVEHVWPHQMGGRNDDSNLKGACRKCNASKADYLEAADFHYEEICLVKDKTDNSFNVDFHWRYKVAIAAKSRFRCSQCGKPAEYGGEVQFGRRELSDSWHYLNIDAYCSEHVPE